MSDLRRLLFANQTRTYEGYPLVISRSVASRYLKQYQIYGNSEQGVPAGYTQLEYLGSDSRSYINTGIAGGKTTFEIGVKFSYSSFVAYGAVYGNYVGDYYQGERCILSDQPGKIITNNGTICTTTGNTELTCAIDVVHTLISKNTEVTLDGATTVITHTAHGTVNSGNIALFNRSITNPNTSRDIGLKVYEFYIKDSDTLVSNLIPCKRNSDNVLGMYDTVSNTFFTNAGTGTFTAGPEVVPTPANPVEVISVGDKIIPAGYQELEYIESTGTQYIDTGFKPNNNTKWEYTFQCTDLTDSVMSGARTGYGNAMFVLSCTGGGTVFGGICGSTTTYLGTITADLLKHTFMMDKNVVYFDGVQKATYGAATFQTSYDMYLLRGNNAGAATNTCNQKAYSSKIWDNGTLVRDYIPAKRLSDSVIGMYDTVSGQFFTNAGSGTFTAGPEVEHYQIPVVATGTSGDPITTPIYLNAPLRKVGDYADYIDYKNQQLVRNVGVKVLDGTESWTSVDQYSRTFIQITDMIAPTSPRVVPAYCNYFENLHNSEPISAVTAGQFYLASPKSVFFHISQATASDFKTWLATQYAAGTPVIVYYPLATPVTESLVAPALPTLAGSTTYTTETEVKPSNMKGIF